MKLFTCTHKFCNILFHRTLSLWNKKVTCFLLPLWVGKWKVQGCKTWQGDYCLILCWCCLWDRYWGTCIYMESMCNTKIKLYSTNAGRSSVMFVATWPCKPAGNSARNSSTNCTTFVVTSWLAQAIKLRTNI